MMTHRPQSPEYDAIVLGSGLGGLFAAALLSQKGLSILLLREKAATASCVRDGYHFVPFSDFSERQARPEVLKWLWDTLGLSPASPVPREARPPGRVSPVSKYGAPFQVILPSSRIDLFEDRGKLRKEWEREFPGEATRVDEFHNRMDLVARSLTEGRPEPRTWPFCLSGSRGLLMKWFSSDPTLDLTSFSKEFQQFIRLRLFSWASFVTEEFPESLAAFFLSRDRSSLPFPSSAFEDLKKRLLSAVVDQGGKVEEVDGIEEANSRWTGDATVFSGKDKKEHRSRVLIINMPLHRLAEIPGSLGERVSRYRKRIRPRYVSVPLFLGLHEGVIPVGMRNLLVSMADLEKSDEGGNTLFISLSPEGEKSEAPEGRRAVTVQSLVPTDQLDRSNLMGHQNAVIRHLKRLIPYLDQFMDFADFNWTMDQVTRWPHWGYPHFIDETPAGFRWKQGILPTRLSGGLYLTGKETFPYLGLEGEMMSGWKVASAVMKKLGRS
jgi:phytoene dehydrogenase-like protein